MYETILTPVDGSAPSEAAADHAIELARDADATLAVVSVVDVAALSAAKLDTEALLDGYEAEAERHVAAVAERARESGVDVETAVVRGAPYQSILDRVDAVGADLVVMGSHGRRGLERYLLGSTTERVLRLSPVPVLVLRGEERDYRDPDADGRVEPADE
ncbi:universal stress protein [Halobellus limi]|jgi:nucleotide-binding universal stress UspA family protein|uniref:Universal stress protein n=1 Tax=Halobellus limi TaxID=699433 RepID=A0A1H6CLB2_9EURY|nr:universal stress protein [Halobellus limi]QCC48759.1 universal stress protein [Halobellus limi]SEG73712.1 Nucleotide-binding universal stress protein, UspA family [Halobellus limi]